MIIYGVDTATVADIVRRVSDERYAGNIHCKSLADVSTRNQPRTRFVLRASDSARVGARRSASGRRTVSACWHAHLDVLRAMFAHESAARVRSRFYSADSSTFEDKARESYNVNAGGEMYHVRFGDLCPCN